MPASLTITNSMNFVRPFLKNQPLMVSSQEPAVTAGNIILQTMLSPPFRWPFNRGTFSFETIADPATTDYVVALSDFGFIEEQWLTDSTGLIHQLNGAICLAKSSAPSRPTLLAPQSDDNAGNITFRVRQVPDAIYTVNGVYQRKAGLITSSASPWGVVPDHFSYIYNLGFLTLLSLLVNDARFPIFEQWFIARLLGAQDGLSDQQRNIFLGAWMNLVRTTARAQGDANSGIAMRAK